MNRRQVSRCNINDSRRSFSRDNLLRFAKYFIGRIPTWRVHGGSAKHSQIFAVFSLHGSPRSSPGWDIFHWNRICQKRPGAGCGTSHENKFAADPSNYFRGQRVPVFFRSNKSPIQENNVRRFLLPSTGNHRSDARPASLNCHDKDIAHVFLRLPGKQKFLGRTMRFASRIWRGRAKYLK